MLYYKKLNILKIDCEKASKEILLLKKLTKDRTGYAKNWKSVDLITNGKPSKLLLVCKYLREWLREADLAPYDTVYVAILGSKGYIDWHVDQNRKELSKAILTYIKVPNNSFLEFKNGVKWLPEEGYSYVFRADLEHRVVNPTFEPRLTICITKEDEYS